jgi:hypothetical protein
LVVNFHGPGPYRLPRPKQVTAEKTAPNVVSLDFHVDDERGDPPKIVSAEMTVAEARNLAIRLWLAAEK